MSAVANAEGRAVFEVEFGTRGVSPSAVCGERRQTDNADRPTVIRTEFPIERHQIERSAADAHHPDATIRQIVQNVSARSSVFALGHNGRPRELSVSFNLFFSL